LAEAKLAMHDAAGALQEAEASLKLRPRDPEAVRLRDQAKAAIR
jgi:hypothetical protein